MTEEKTQIYRITDLNEMERPRERLENLGAEALSSAELIAILLRVGIRGENAVQVGHRLLTDLEGIKGLHSCTFEELCQQKGLGLAKAAQIKAAIELGRRIAISTPDERPMIRGPKDVDSIVQYEMSAFTQENLWVMDLDTKNKVLSIEKLYKGSLNASMVRVGELFRSAVRRNAASIILIHNHPSGDPTPSPEDITLTRIAVQSGKLLDIEVLDHIIIGQGSFISLKDKGLGFG
ncbi:MAG: DNA repair protein RadC [Anaerolineaceae bacterium]|nr:DNA repair protein RadC [Anaerolineaceae bacterium]